MEVLNLKQLGLQKQVRPCKAIKYLERTFNVVIIAALTAIPAFAATDMWTKANEVMKDVYNQILAISTIAAVVCGATALLLMNFSRNGKTVDESRAWLKRICVTWVILNSLGFILAYITPFFNGGKYAA